MWAFNREFDYIQTKKKSTAFAQGAVLFSQALQYRWPRPSCRFITKLLWDVMDDKGALMHVSAIYTVFQGTKLTGIVFEHGGGQVRQSVGCTDGEMHAMSIEEGHVVSRIDVATSGSEHAIIVSIAFAHRLLALIRIS
jgi:hypothetical protein